VFEAYYKVGRLETIQVMSIVLNLEKEDGDCEILKKVEEQLERISVPRREAEEKASGAW